MVDNVPFSQIPQSLTALISAIGHASSVRVIEGWIALSYIPHTQIGRHRLVNLAALIKGCIEQAEFCLSPR
ncbi:hypothetical protein [Chromobacterium vaccinii]|uniref:hypothetical protein n=1 Tax=Chromobacterium vaccinii TaxID=1108595 RepID=UPI001E4DA4B6|nr:hypothetical protein [Chromobacterium vaccinii]MCD4500163.1 hypothetical protein [Chromobacterium vaccinii]